MKLRVSGVHVRLRSRGCGSVAAAARGWARVWDQRQVALAAAVPPPSRLAASVCAEITLSGLPATEKLVEFLVKRMASQNHNVKEKTLLVVKVSSGGLHEGVVS